jgi:pilus assembly protein Flp/PilA
MAVAPLMSEALAVPGKFLARQGRVADRIVRKLRRYRMINMLKNLHKEESGQDLIEYGLIALIIALGALVGMGQLASSINNEYTKIGSHLS